jgi:hypothetical protein
LTLLNDEEKKCAIESLNGKSNLCNVQKYAINPRAQKITNCIRILPSLYAIRTQQNKIDQHSIIKTSRTNVTYLELNIFSKKPTIPAITPKINPKTKKTRISLTMKMPS